MNEKTPCGDRLSPAEMHKCQLGYAYFWGKIRFRPSLGGWGVVLGRSLTFLYFDNVVRCDVL